MGISLTNALAQEVASLDSIFSLGFQLRHCSVCVYGENLAECFRRLRAELGSGQTLEHGCRKLGCCVS